MQEYLSRENFLQLLNEWDAFQPCVHRNYLCNLRWKHITTNTKITVNSVIGRLRHFSRFILPFSFCIIFLAMLVDRLLFSLKSIVEILVVLEGSDKEGYLVSIFLKSYKLGKNVIFMNANTKTSDCVYNWV